MDFLHYREVSRGSLDQLTWSLNDDISHVKNEVKPLPEDDMNYYMIIVWAIFWTVVVNFAYKLVVIPLSNWT